jgi:hypothetical protein
MHFVVWRQSFASQAKILRFLLVAGETFKVLPLLGIRSKPGLLARNVTEKSLVEEGISKLASGRAGPGRVRSASVSLRNSKFNPKDACGAMLTTCSGGRRHDTLKNFQAAAAVFQTAAKAASAASAGTLMGG